MKSVGLKEGLSSSAEAEGAGAGADDSSGVSEGSGELAGGLPRFRLLVVLAGVSLALGPFFWDEGPGAGLDEDEAGRFLAAAALLDAGRVCCFAVVLGVSRPSVLVVNDSFSSLKQF